MTKRRFRLWSPRLTTRRLTLFTGLLSLAAITLIISLSSWTPQSPNLPDSDIKEQTADDTQQQEQQQQPPPAQSQAQPARAPPRREHDEYAGSSWWTDEAWLSAPISGALTKDSRVLLPPLPERRPIYCYRNDEDERQDGEEKEAEDALLLTWRRAWWVRGFNPVVLGSGDAAKHPRFGEVKRRGLESALELELLRWLAWDAAGTGGVLVESTVVPMGPPSDDLPSALLHPVLTMWKGLRGALVSGPAGSVSSAVQAALDTTTAKNVVAMLPRETLRVLDDPAPSSVAYYSPRTVSKRYAAVARAAYHGGRAAGLRSLDTLINTHLHAAWQAGFPQGIDVLKPFPLHTTRMTSQAVALAESLAGCPIMPSAGCPPNMPRCATPCRAQPVSTGSQYRGSQQGVFTLGVVPHPWTLAALDMLHDTLDVQHRGAAHDVWVATVMGEQGGASIRSFKEIAAAGAGTSSLWLTAEDPLPVDLDWMFGFALPRRHLAVTTSTSPPVVAAAAVNPVEDPALEWILLERARQIVAGDDKDKDDLNARAELEEWNPADTEAWKFARGMLARGALERALSGATVKTRRRI